MKILLTNDDGIQSPALLLLARRLAALGQIYIAAPSREQSGVGHGITAHVPLRAYPQSFSELTQWAWAIDGTPADCVKLAMEILLPEKPDLVVSGINYGANLGTDVVYSGTVAAAMEGYLFGLPAMAISATGIRRGAGQGNFDYAAEQAARLCRLWQQRDFQPRTMLNVNVPGSVPEDVKGCRLTRLGWRWYHDAYEQRTDPHGKSYYWLQGTAYDGEGDGNTDVEACRDGYVSITPLFHDLTDLASLAAINNMLEQ